MGEALRFKEYQRYGFVFIDKYRKPEDILKELSQISFNFAEITFELKKVTDKTMQVHKYTDKNQVFEDFFISKKVLNRLI